jgi:hypothetical protein
MAYGYPAASLQQRARGILEPGMTRSLRRTAVTERCDVRRGRLVNRVPRAGARLVSGSVRHQVADQGHQQVDDFVEGTMWLVTRP